MLLRSSRSALVWRSTGGRRVVKNRREAERMNRVALRLFADLGRSVNCAPLRDWGDLRRTYPNERLMPKQFDVECGTDSGYYLHRKNGSQPCLACRQAHNLSTQRRNKRKRSA